MGEFVNLSPPALPETCREVDLTGLAVSGSVLLVYQGRGRLLHCLLLKPVRSGSRRLHITPGDVALVDEADLWSARGSLTSELDPKHVR